MLLATANSAFKIGPARSYATMRNMQLNLMHLLGANCIAYSLIAVSYNLQLIGQVINTLLMPIHLLSLS